MGSRDIELIAEIGQAHEGSLGMAHAYIDALRDTGVDVIKWQVHIAEAESSPEEPFRVRLSSQDASRMDYWRRMEFTLPQWRELKAHCEEAGMEFLASPFSVKAVEWLEELGVRRYKIGSGEVTNFLLLERIAQTAKPVILSSGMSSWEELDEAVHFLRPRIKQLAVLQCTTAYPTAPEEYGLNLIGALKERYPDVRVGFSDHSGDIYAPLAAAVLGAEILEFHVVFDKRMFGPDVQASISIDRVRDLVRGVRTLQRALSHSVDKVLTPSLQAVKGIFEKSLAVSRDMRAGERIRLEDLEAKKPAGMGIPAREFERVLGRRLRRAKHAYEFLKDEDLDEPEGPK